MSGTASLEAFQISAPGKVILHGEHSVVYGKPAIAGPIGLRTVLTYERLEADEVRLNFSSIPFVSSMPIKAFNAFLADYDCAEKIQPLEFLAQMRASYPKFIFADYVNQQPAPDSIKERFSLGVALYLLNRILRSEGVSAPLSYGFQLSIQSSMSIGAGLGSSAGFGVCFSTAGLMLARIVKGELSAATTSYDDYSFQKAELEKICGWAFDSEIIMHERPSGIDNTICTYGSLIKFIRGQPIETLSFRKEIAILIVDTGVSRCTADLVASVAKLKQAHPRMIDSVLDAMGFLVDDVVKLLETADSDDDDSDVRMRRLVSANNNLLRVIGVSHPALEKIFQIVDAYEGYAAKLTGAGGGGCALIYLPKDFSTSTEYAQLRAALTEAGFQWKQTLIGGEGVKFRFFRP